MKLHKWKPDKEACDPTIYQSMIGSLMYAMTTTPPDIAYAIGVLSRYNHDLTNEHMIPLKRVFWYLNGTKDWRLRFGGAVGGALGERALEGEGESLLGCYVDSDYAGCPDDYKSTSRLVIIFGGAVDWRSRKQKSTAQSTTDAEYYTFGVVCMRLTKISHLEWARHPNDPSRILRFTVTDREHQEQNLPWNCSCTHCDQVLSCCRYG